MCHEVEKIRGIDRFMIVDLIIELPLSDGYDAIMVIVDKFTKCAHFLPTTTHLSAEGAALLLCDNVWHYVRDLGSISITDQALK